MKLAKLLVPFLNDDIALPVFQGMCGDAEKLKGDYTIET